eukprot:gene27637-36443_t
MPHSKLNQELADIFFPAIFMQDVNGLADAYSSEEVSYTRFVITMFLFCEMLTLLTEINDSFASKVLLRAVQQQPKEKEVSLGSIVKFGVKYPVLFYALERFKKMCRRFVFGDKFWSTKKYLKLKVKEALHIQTDVKTSYQNMESAVSFTAASAITDAINGYPQNKSDGCFQLTDILYTPQDQVTYISEDDAIILKDVFGYKDAKRLVAESGIPFEAPGLQFLSGFESGGGEEKEDHDLRVGEQQEEHKDGQHESSIDKKKKTKKLTVFDKAKDRNFIHDPETGETAWGQQLIQPDDSIFKEVFLYNK